jgi:hypothetical protein
MQPEGQFLGASLQGGIGLGVSPFSEGGLDEALGLAVGLWGVGLGTDVLEPAIAAGVTEVERPVARAVIGHHPGNADAEALVSLCIAGSREGVFPRKRPPGIGGSGGRL